MVPPSTLTSIIPSPTWDPNFGHLDIKNDVLYPKELTPYTPRDQHIRIAMFVVNQALPPIAAIVLVFSQTGWWKTKYQWSFSRLCILWFISVQIVGAIVYFQDNATTRTFFVTAGLHLQIEYMIVALLLKSSNLQALVIAYIVGFILYAIQLFASDLSVVYIITTITGGTDFLIPILLFYGKQWLYGIGGVGHLLSAVSVFSFVVKDYGLVPFSILAFISVWLHIGPIAFHSLSTRSTQNTPRGDISLPDDGPDGDFSTGESSQQAYDNPLKDVDIPRLHLYLMVGGAFFLSFVTSLVFVFVIGK